MVAYQQIVRYQPDWDYPASDAAIMASPVHKRLIATLFYDPAITTDDARVLVVVQGGGAFATSGNALTNLNITPITGEPGQFNYFGELYALGWKILSLAYPVETLLGENGQFPTGDEVWYATAAELDAVMPGRGAFDPSQWIYDDTTKRLRIDASKLDRPSAEHSIVHLLQLGGIDGASYGMSTDIANDWVVAGRSMGSDLGQFVMLSQDRSDPNATPGTRYAMPTRPLTLVSHQSVCTWKVYKDNVKIPHWTGYDGTLKQTIGEGKDETGPNGENQIDLASGLYYGFANADVEALNAVTPMVFMAADLNDPTHEQFVEAITDWTYDGMDSVLWNIHPLDGVIAMRDALLAATPASGELNVHAGQSIFYTTKVDHTHAAQLLEFILGLFEEPPPPPSPLVFSLASAAKLSFLDVRLQPEVGDAEVYTDQRATEEDDATVAPAFDVRIPEDAPGIVQDEFELDLPEDIAGDLVLALGDGEATPRVDVKVTERITDPDGALLDSTVLWWGTVERAVKNPRGKAGRVRIVGVDELSYTRDANLGLKCNQFCQHRFGKGGCRTAATNLPDLVQEGQVQGINGRTVTITGVTPSLDYATHYKHGYVERAGVRIPVADWSSAAPTVYVLRRAPPASWLDAAVDVTPGCDKTPANCTAWANDDRFLGLGLRMPDHQPNYQQPRS